MKKLFFTLRSLVTLLAVSFLFMILPVSPAAAANVANGAKIFNANCSACHLAGNNLIVANKTLKKDALEKYTMNSLAAIETQIAQGKNAMPAFSGRLNDDQIEDVATYVLEQAASGW